MPHVPSMQLLHSIKVCFDEGPLNVRDTQMWEDLTHMVVSAPSLEGSYQNRNHLPYLMRISVFIKCTGGRQQRQPFKSNIKLSQSFNFPHFQETLATDIKFHVERCSFQHYLSCETLGTTEMSPNWVLGRQNAVFIIQYQFVTMMRFYKQRVSPKSQEQLTTYCK